MTLRAVYLATPVLALGIACSGMGGAKTQGDAQAGTTGASGSASASTTTGTTAGARTIMGRVSQASSDQLVVETMEGRRETLNVHSQTAITIDGQVARVSDLQPGQMVRASYDEQAGQKNAVSIQAGHHDTGSMHGSGSVGSGTSGGTVENPGAAGQAGDTGRPSDTGSYQSPGQSGSGTGTGETDTSGTGSTGDTTSSPSGVESSGGTGSANDTGQSGDRSGQDAPGDPTGAGSSDTSSTGGKY